MHVHTFAGIDVSSRELSVALRHGQGGDQPAMAKFRTILPDTRPWSPTCSGAAGQYESVNVRGLPELASAPKLPGRRAWHTTYT